MKTTLARLALPMALLAALSLTIAACSSGAAASAPPTGSPIASDPDDSVTSPSDPGAGGSGGAGGDNIVIPQPGTFNPHPVAVEKVEPSVDGRNVKVKLTWTSGVAPCYVLDEVIVNRDGNDIALTVVEGAAEKGAMCIEIAEQKSTIVDLGELEPGDYTISATDSDVPPVTITVT